jgi:hypothetical protein
MLATSASSALLRARCAERTARDSRRQGPLELGKLCVMRKPDRVVEGPVSEPRRWFMVAGSFAERQ